MHHSPPTAWSAEALLSHADFLRAIARGLLADDAAADDVVQDTLVTAIERPPHAPAGLRGWLATVASNFARQRRRAAVRRLQREHAAARPTVAPSTAEVHEREALRSRVVQAVLTLPEAYRDVVLLRYYDERPPRAIAKALAVPVETVRTRLKRGLERLRAELQNDLRVDHRTGVALAALAVPAELPPAAGPLLLTLLGTRGAIACAATLAVLVGVYVAWPRGETPSPTPGNTAPGPVVADAGAEPRPADRRTAAAAGPAQRTLVGQVVRPDGQPIDGTALLYVNPDGPPPDGPRPAGLAAASALRRTDGSSATLLTSAGGGFRVDLGDRDRAWVEVLDVPADLPPAGGWVDVPNPGLVLRLLPAPTAVVQIRAEADGKAVPAFTVDAHRGGRVLPGGEATDGLLQLTWPLTNAPDGDEFELRATAAQFGSATTRIRLRTGDTRQVMLRFDAPLELHGVVVDEAGLPIADALVYFGTFERLRGDEPFKPFRPVRVQDGVRSDAAGRYTLAGAGARISVFHPAWTPVTVARTDAARVALPPLGAIIGRLVDPSGAPRAGVTIQLDREREVTTDAAGGFRFDGVFAGVRGLCLPERQYVGVAVRSGATTTVEIGRDLVDVRLQLRGIERGPAVDRGIVLVGTDAVAALLPGRVDGGVVSLPRVRPGHYWLMVAGTPIATVDLARPAMDVEIGSATLTVRGAAGARIVVVPADADELLRTIAARPSPTSIAADGLARFRGMPDGDYEVIDATTGRVWRVRVAAPGAELALD